MKITIAGAGEIGFYLASMLSEERYDVIIIDKDESSLSEISNSFDLQTISGNATSIKTLSEAGIHNSDLFIAVTDVDEVNMIACMISKRLGAKKTIARIRNIEYAVKDSLVSPEYFGIDVVIQPEFTTAKDVLLLIKRAAASDVIDIADGRMQLIGLKLDRNTQLHGNTIQEFVSKSFISEFRIVAILRGNRTIIPTGKDKLIREDQLFVLSKSEHINTVIRQFGLKKQRIERVMIAGGGILGEHIIRLLQLEVNSIQIKLIEENEERCYDLATQFPDILVLKGNPTDPDLLVSEGIGETDVFISVTSDEESNIISCLMAKHLGVYKVVANVSKGSYIPLSQTIGLDSAVNIKLSASNEIHRHLMKDEIQAVRALWGTDTEMIELVIKEDSKFKNKKISDLKFPKGAIIGAIFRKNTSLIATGEETLLIEDRLVIFATHSYLEKVIDFFS